MFEKMLSEKIDTEGEEEEEDDDTIIDVGKMSPENRQVVGSNLCQVDSQDEAYVRVSGADSSSEKEHNMVIKNYINQKSAIEIFSMFYNMPNRFIQSWWISIPRIFK